MVKKRSWHCGHCGMPCEIGKVSKNHRHLICPQHGVIASNPLPLIAAGMLAAKYAPAAIGAAKKFLGAKSTESPAAQEMRAAGYPQQIKIIKQPILVDID